VLNGLVLGEAVIFHNHPRNDLNHLFDNLPLASNTDRKTLENMALNLVQICRRLSGAGRVLFYLGENGFVREFRLAAAGDDRERRWPDSKALILHEI